MHGRKELLRDIETLLFKAGYLLGADNLDSGVNESVVLLGEGPVLGADFLNELNARVFLRQHHDQLLEVG